MGAATTRAPCLCHKGKAVPTPPGLPTNVIWHPWQAECRGPTHPCHDRINSVPSNKLYKGKALLLPQLGPRAVAALVAGRFDEPLRRWPGRGPRARRSRLLAAGRPARVLSGLGRVRGRGCLMRSAGVAGARRYSDGAGLGRMYGAPPRRLRKHPVLAWPRLWGACAPVVGRTAGAPPCRGRARARTAMSVMYMTA